MVRILIICLTAESGINPLIIGIEDLSKVDYEVKKFIESIYEDRPLVYVEVYRLLGDDIFAYLNSYSFDGVTLSKCYFFAPSSCCLKSHFEQFSFEDTSL